MSLGAGLAAQFCAVGRRGAVCMSLGAELAAQFCAVGTAHACWTRMQLFCLVERVSWALRNPRLCRGQRGYCQGTRKYR